MIYIVDDATDYRFLMQQVFRRFLPQYPVRLFTDGLDLIQFIDEPATSRLPDQSCLHPERPGLVVLDVDMPKMNGFQTLERLKQHTSWQSVPVVMMSGRIETRFAEAAAQGGASSYIVKPMGLAETQQVMAQLCHQWLDQYQPV